VLPNCTCPRNQAVTSDWPQRTAANPLAWHGTPELADRCASPTSPRRNQLPPDSAICTCLFTGHAFTLRSRVPSCFVDEPRRLRAVTQLNDAQASQPATAPRVGSLFTWSRNQRRSMALHLRRLRAVGHQQGPSPPRAQAPAVQLPSHDQPHQRRGRRASQGRGPPVFLSPAGPPPRRDRVREVT
jgi:hypothetical protein